VSRRISLVIAAVLAVGIVALAVAFNLPLVMVSRAASAPTAAPPSIAPSAAPTASTLADLRTRLLEPPPGSTWLDVDGDFTFNTIPTDLVWETVNRAGFIRGVTRQWRESDGTVVDIVIFQFVDLDAASSFAHAAEAVLTDGRFGCQGWVQLPGPAHGQLYGCNATTAATHDSWRAEMYLSVYAASVVVIPPGPRGTKALTDPAQQQATLLA
jgi:hypothetical protein